MLRLKIEGWPSFCKMLTFSGSFMIYFAFSSSYQPGNGPNRVSEDKSLSTADGGQPQKLSAVRISNYPAHLCDAIGRNNGYNWVYPDNKR